MGGIEEFTRLTGNRFTINPDGNVGASNSAHEVFFGRLNGKNVAVKPHSSEAAARHEHAMLRHVLGLGFTALTPLRIIEGEQGKGAFLLTERMNLISAASLPLAGPIDQIKPSIDSVSRIASTLADLHAKGISHGDSQIKNFGLMRSLSTQPPVVVYDLEKGGSNERGHFKNQPFAHDVDSLTQSLAHKSFGGPVLSMATDALQEHVLNPYLEQAVSSGMDPLVATDAIYSGYGSFIDVHERLRYAESNGGHALVRAKNSN